MSDEEHPHQYRAPFRPSWQQHTQVRQVAATVYTNVKCAACGRALEPVFEDVVEADGTWNALQAKDALMICLAGGYGEFVDTSDGDLQVYLCKECAIEFVNTNPWSKSVIAGSLDINVGHECGGDIVWTPQSQCRVHPDAHGWGTNP